MEILLLLDLYVWCVLTAEYLVRASTMNENLQAYLFKDYNKHIRPSRNVDDILRVDFYLTLLQLISVDEKSEEMTTSQYITLRWLDHRLSWDPSKFGGIEGIRVPSQIVWKPDLALSNNIDGQYDKSVPVNALLNHTGLVEWIPPAIYKSSCKIQVEYFPFDWQNCTLRFRSFTYSSHEIKLRSVYSKVVVDKEAYTDNGEWKIIHCPVKINVRNEDYEDIILYFIIQRKPLFYIINIIVPCVLISSLSVFVFYLPSGCSEKTNLSISVLLGLPVYLLLLAKRVPETSLAVPLIGTYLLFTMLSVTFSVIFSVVVLNIHHRNPMTHEMAPWIRTIFVEFLPPLLHMDIRFTKAVRQDRSSFVGGRGVARSKRLSTQLKTENDISQKRKWDETEEDHNRSSSSGRAASFVKQGDFNDVLCGKEPHSPGNSIGERVESTIPGKRHARPLSQTIGKKAKTLAKSPAELQPTLANERRKTLVENQKLPEISVMNRITNGMANNIEDQEYFRLSCKDQEEVPRNIAEDNSVASSPVPKFRDAYFNIKSRIRRGGVTLANPKSRLPLSASPAVSGGSFVSVKSTRPSAAATAERDTPLTSYESIKVRNPALPTTDERSIRISCQVQNPRREEPENLRIRRIVHALPDSANECLQAVDFICRHVRDENQKKEKSHEWLIVAMVMDQLLFWTFLLVYISGSLYFAIQALTNFPPDHPFHSGEPKYASCWEEHEHLAANGGRSFVSLM